MKKNLIFLIFCLPIIAMNDDEFWEEIARGAICGDSGSIFADLVELDSNAEKQTAETIQNNTEPLQAPQIAELIAPSFEKSQEFLWRNIYKNPRDKPYEKKSPTIKRNSGKFRCYSCQEWLTKGEVADHDDCVAAKKKSPKTVVHRQQADRKCSHCGDLFSPDKFAKHEKLCGYYASIVLKNRSKG